ncbi:hypothetical protein ACFLZ2_01660 [Candidatus Margulisiibacteriota bacterium]
MSKLLKLFKEKPLTLIVSLPENSAELAEAAERGGADAIKIHMNMKHAASGTVFGPFDQEKEAVKAILDKVKVPVGIVPGNEILPAKEDMAALKKMGIDFFDLFHSRIPNWMFNLKGFGKVAALNEEYSVERLMELKDLRMDCLEAAIIPKSDYGKDLTVSDLQNYITIAVTSPLPVIVPTQKFIRTSDVPLLWDAGVAALMIGAIVAGDSSTSIHEATKKFKAEIGKLDK